MGIGMSGPNDLVFTSWRNCNKEIKVRERHLKKSWTNFDIC